MQASPGLAMPFAKSMRPPPPQPISFPGFCAELESLLSYLWGLREGATAQRDTPSAERSRGWAEVTSPPVGVEMVAPPGRDPCGQVLPVQALC